MLRLLHIVPRDLWDQVQSSLNGARTSGGATTASGDTSLLTGLLFDDTGDRLTPSHASKPRQRYRYYVSRRLIEERSDDPTGWRLPALEIEAAVTTALAAWLRNPPDVTSAISEQNLTATNLNQSLNSSRQLADRIQHSASQERREVIAKLIARITITGGTLVLNIRHSKFLQDIGITSTGALDFDATEDECEITVPFTLRRRGVEAKLVIAGQSQTRSTDPVLIGTIARAYAWFQQLTARGQLSVNDIAIGHGIAPNEISRLLPLAFLAPDTVEAILSGQHSAGLTAKRLTRLQSLPLDWVQQRQMLGFTSIDG